jgi:hypothetical protein
MAVRRGHPSLHHQSAIQQRIPFFVANCSCRKKPGEKVAYFSPGLFVVAFRYLDPSMKDEANKSVLARDPVMIQIQYTTSTSAGTPATG